MQKHKWLNTDYIVARINECLRDRAFELIEPDPTKGICNEEGTLWLIDLSGEIVLEDFDITEFGEGFNLLKSEEPFGFEDFIANVCDGLLIKAGHDFESSDCSMYDDQRNSVRILEIDDIDSAD